MTTYTKVLLEKNQKQIVRDFDGVRNFYETISYLKKSRRTGTWNAIYDAYSAEGYGAVYYYRMFEYLKHTIPDFNEESYIYKRDGSLKTERVEQVYCGMMATAGTKLYERLEAGKPAFAPKKDPTKKAKTNGLGL